MELHSEIESYRQVLQLHTPEGAPAALIVLRRKSAVWLTFQGAMKTTVVMRDQEAGRLIEAVNNAAGDP